MRFNLVARVSLVRLKLMGDERAFRRLVYAPKCIWGVFTTYLLVLFDLPVGCIFGVLFSSICNPRPERRLIPNPPDAYRLFTRLSDVALRRTVADLQERIRADLYYQLPSRRWYLDVIYERRLRLNFLSTCWEAIRRICGGV